MIVPRRAAAITQADVARAIRAAKQEGWHSVRIITATGATIEIRENHPPEPAIDPKKLEMPLEVI